MNKDYIWDFDYFLFYSFYHGTGLHITSHHFLLVVLVTFVRAARVSFCLPFRFLHHLTTKERERKKMNPQANLQQQQSGLESVPHFTSPSLVSTVFITTVLLVPLSGVCSKSVKSQIKCINHMYVQCMCINLGSCRFIFELTSLSKMVTHANV